MFLVTVLVTIHLQLSAICCVLHCKKQIRVSPIMRRNTVYVLAEIRYHPEDAVYGAGHVSQAVR